MHYVLPKMPAMIRVGVNNYHVNVVDPLQSMSKGEWGSVANTSQVIEYQAIYPCPGQALDTVIHELLHTCYSVYRIKEGQDEELTVNPLAPAIAGILIDNPGLLAVIQQITEDARQWPETVAMARFHQ